MDTHTHEAVLGALSLACSFVAWPGVASSVLTQKGQRPPGVPSWLLVARPEAPSSVVCVAKLCTHSANIGTV